ncbi:MAG: EVE domain-containing protein, partial [Gammaproteobacteria bacterium]|nr:EVE domain-containing protein [Gammaproteobacteria bacterium]
SAFETSKHRLQYQCWPLYKNTPHRKVIKKGDKVVIYMAGTKEHSQSFFATASITSVDSNNNNCWNLDKLATEQAPYSIVVLECINIFKIPIPIKPKLENLTFIPANKSKWGAVMRTGCKLLSNEDYSFIISGQML